VALLFNKSAFARTMTKCLVLQRALATFVAHWAVERMIRKQQLEHTLLGFLDALGLGINNLTFCNGRHARHHHHRSAWTDNFNETLAAHAHRLHARVIAKAWNEIVRAVCRSNDHLALACSNDFAINGDAHRIWIHDWLWGCGV
jgi:hypothetical protein